MPFDGKVLRGSFDHFKDQKAVQILSAFLTDSDIILATEEIAEKTNEIPTAQELILRLGLSNCVFTLDALHFQTQTLAAAMATGNEVIVQVKANQPILLQDCLSTAATEEPLAVYQEPVTKAHHRIEGRTVSVFAPQSIREVEKWHLVEAIVNVDRQRLEFDTEAKCWQHSDEISFYIATVLLTASEFGEAIRWHWGIENRNHYVRDVNLGEDHSRISDNPHIFAKLRSFALNMMRHNQVAYIKLELFKNCMSLDTVLNYVGVT